MGKKNKQKRNSSCDPFQSMKPMALDSGLEAMARDLFEKACGGSKSIWPEIPLEGNSFKMDIDLRKRFLASAHSGMRKAQNQIIDEITASDCLSPSQDILFRGISDAIAWQFLGAQLCHARRLYKGNKQPDLKESNLESVLKASKDLITTQPDVMPLITDLTSFVQVGDIIANDPDQGMSIIEVKEGEENKRIGDFMKFYMESRCDKALELFSAERGPKSVKQLGRMIRQVGRMSHVVEIMSSGESTDPDTGTKIHIPDEYIKMDYWDDHLDSLIDESEKKGWSIGVIDDCLFVGCYSKNPMLSAGHLAFNAWFDESGGTETCPRGCLLDAMQIPLALPIFSRELSPDRIFDLLFGRLQICMGLNIDALLNSCATEGLKVRSGTNKETSQIEQRGMKPFRNKGKSIFIGNGEKEMILMDGVFLRAMYHGQRPISIIKTFFGAA